MPILHAIVLGIVQGLTEFLPISSSGHLALFPWLFGWDDFDDPTIEQAFDVAVHMGTLVAVMGYFRNDIGRLVVGGLRTVRPGGRSLSFDGRFAWLLVLSAVPAGLAGVLGGDAIEELGDRLWMIALALIVFGFVLFYADKRPSSRRLEQINGRDAGGIGLAQTLALQPGVSRSAVTMAAARWLGFERDAAARIAFLMSVPLIAGAGLFKFIDIGGFSGIPSDLRVPFAVGMATSAVTGWLAVWGTLKLIQTKTFLPFAIYRIVLGVFVLALLASPWR